MTKSGDAARRAGHRLFDLTGRVVVITGGAGLLGIQHAEAVASVGGIPVLLDLESSEPVLRASELSSRVACSAAGLECDITGLEAVESARDEILARFGRCDVLINNAANNPKVEGAQSQAWTRLENFPTEVWNQDIAVGLTGAFLCSRVFGAGMATSGGGVILNVASDLALISPDQRLYRVEGLEEKNQMVKPVTYSVVKTGLLGLTRYLATYWAANGVRVNALCPGGVSNGQPPDFVDRLTALIPMGRMAGLSEYQGVVIFLCSDASSYMTGAVIAADGGRTTW